MQNPFKNIITKTRGVVITEDNLTKIIIQINRCRKRRRNIVVEPCGWEKSNKWYLQFRMSDYQWENFVARIRCSTELDPCTVETFTNGNFRP